MPCVGNPSRPAGKINDCAFLAQWVVVGYDCDPVTYEPRTTILGACPLHKPSIAQWSSLPDYPALVAEVAALPTILEQLWGDGISPWTMENQDRITA